MNAEPKITVLISVFNGARYVKPAVESVLCQTFADFELLVIDDGSTDGTPEILEGFHDRRMRVVTSQVNRGLTRSLNLGIEMARGEYLARMDADDVCRPDRLSRQVDFLEANPDIDVVASRVRLLDEEGCPLGTWREDMQAVSATEIRKTLPGTNCIAHPSVMMRTETARRYRYDERLSNSQDYDLWLRLCSDGRSIAKIDDELVSLRVHDASITARSNRGNALPKVIRCKALHLLSRMRSCRMNLFTARVLASLALDCSAYASTMAFRAARALLLRAGESISPLFFPRPAGEGFFFFFPDHNTGGATKVHRHILECVREKRPEVFFVCRSSDKAWRSGFDALAGTHDLSAFLATWLRYPLYFIVMGIITGHINRTPGALVFGANNSFFYRMLPFLRKGVVRMDLTHAVLDDSRIPFVRELDARVVISRRAFEDIRDQYRRCNVPRRMLERVTVIENFADAPDHLPEKKDAPVQVLFVGRGSEEKRVHLVGRAATLLRQVNAPVDVTLAGDVERAVAPEDRASCTFLGEISDPLRLSEIYASAHVLVLVSSREGFPLAVMEAMAWGVIPVCTPVGGIPDHVTDGVSGILLDRPQDEAAVVLALKDAVLRISNDRNLRLLLSRNAYEYARAHFSREPFRQAYRRLFSCRR